MTRPTICVECKWHQAGSTTISSWILPFVEVDRCLSPAARNPPKRNFVTGKVEEQFLPPCRLINTDGNCPHYEAKS